VDGDRLSPRARYREQTRSEIKEVAPRQLAEGGTAAVALTRVAEKSACRVPRCTGTSTAGTPC
jgi:hypothetical protein